MSWVQYSPDAGATWLVLAQAVSTQELTVDFGTLPGAEGTGLVRVLVSDGVNTGTGTSSGFSVSKKSPSVDILSPEPDAEEALGQPVFLRGFGYDLDDGPLPDSAHGWTSSLDGVLGSSSELVIRTLSEGEHLIRLDAADSDGNPASAEVRISVVVEELSEVADEDEDRDGVEDYRDNCLGVANGAQRDTDVDGYGNRCDGDLNNDEKTNVFDLGLFKQGFGGTDPDLDFTGDGKVNILDLGVFKQLFGEPPGPSCCAAP